MAMPRRKRYRADRGCFDVRQACISMPPAELAAIDRSADAAQMSRSHWLRQAAKRFLVWLEDPRDPPL